MIFISLVVTLLFCLDIITSRKEVSLLTRWCNSVLPGGFVVAKGEQQRLDGADEDGSQEAIENDVEQDNFDCGREKERNYCRSQLEANNQFDIQCSELVFTVMNISIMHHQLG